MTMEIEPEVLPPEGRTRSSTTPNPFPAWKRIVAGVVGLGIFCLVLWLAFWVAVVFIGLALLGWLIRSLITLFTGGPPASGSSSNVQVTIRRGPRGR